MSFLLDTDIASAYLRGDARVFNRFVQHGGGLYLSRQPIPYPNRPKEATWR